jgi:hypothetical protein
VDIPALAINSLPAGTITAWINPADISSGVIVAKQHSGVDSYAIFSIGSHGDGNGQPAQGKPGVLYFTPQDATTAAASTATVTNQTWQQVVVVFTNGSCAFYINGISCGGTNTGDYSIPNDLNADSTSIGCWNGSGFTVSQRIRFIGSIDDVRIYNRALSAGEVEQLYQIEGVPDKRPAGVSIGKAVSVRLNNLTVGYSYQIQTSTDGRYGKDYGLPFTALTKSMTYGYLNTDEQGHLFFSVRLIR